DRPINEGGNRLGLDAAIAEDVFGAGIERHDAVEHAGMGVAVELDEDLAFAHDFDRRGGNTLPTQRAGAGRRTDWKSVPRNPIPRCRVGLVWRFEKVSP